MLDEWEEWTTTKSHQERFNPFPILKGQASSNNRFRSYWGMECTAHVCTVQSNASHSVMLLTCT